MNTNIKWAIGIAVVLVILFQAGVFDKFLEKSALQSVNRLGTMAVIDIEGDACDDNIECGGCWAEDGIGYIACNDNQCDTTYCVDIKDDKAWLTEKVKEHKKYILYFGILVVFSLAVFGGGTKFKLPKL